MTVQYQVIEPNMMLYRAALIIEPQPKPRKCKDTYKTGVYFSLNHPYLAENMVIESDMDLPIAVYKTTEPITVAIGKYAFKERSPDREHPLNESHVEYGIGPVNDTVNEPHGIYYKDYPAAELFLTEENLSKIQYLGCYFRTVKEAYDIWCKNLRLEEGDAPLFEGFYF